jgi:Domain of unknown function (DUF6285)
VVKVVGPHDVPSAAQLVESVREWIERDLIPASQGRVQFQARGALTALSIVERELSLSDELAERHAERLAALGCADDTELAAKIRAGAFDGRHGEVRAAVRESVVDKLRVANPRYLDDEQ